jgi:hypothetical protein
MLPVSRQPVLDGLGCGGRDVATEPAERALPLLVSACQAISTFLCKSYPLSSNPFDKEFSGGGSWPGSSESHRWAAAGVRLEHRLFSSVKVQRKGHCDHS